MKWILKEDWSNLWDNIDSLPKNLSENMTADELERLGNTPIDWGTFKPLAPRPNDAEPHDWYVIFFRYDRGEDYSIYYFGDDKAAAEAKWPEIVLDFFNYGPDDVSQLWFCKLTNLPDELISKLTLAAKGKLSDNELIKLCNEVFGDDFGWDRSCYWLDDLGSYCGGGEDVEAVIALMAEDDGLDPNEIDEEVYDEYWNKVDEMMGSNEYKKYLKRVLNI